MFTNKRKTTLFASVVAAAALTLGACGAKTEPEPSTPPAETAEAEASTLETTGEPAEIDEEEPKSTESPEEIPAEDTVDTVESTVDNVEEETEDTRTDEEKMNDGYGIIIEKYLTAITDKWSMEDLERNDMCTLLNFNYDRGVDFIGSTRFYDLNNDGMTELLVGEVPGENTDNTLVYAAYTYFDGEVKPLFISTERDRYYLVTLFDNDDKAVNVLNEGSSGAADSFSTQYRAEDGKLINCQSIIYNEAADANDPWFVSYDTPPTVEGAEHISADDARDIMDASQQHIVHIAFEPMAH